MVDLLETIEAEIRDAGSLSLEGVGDRDALWLNKDVLAAEPVAPYIVDLICREWDQLPREDAVGFVLAVAAETTSPLALSDSLEIVLGSEQVLAVLGRGLGTVLIDRGNAGASDGGEIATRALEGALRLELGGWSDRRLDLLLALSRFGGSANPHAVARLCRLIGISDEQWPTEELLTRLSEEIETGDPTGDASFELGLAKLRRALEYDNVARILEGLGEAREDLRSARAAIEERTDALVYELAVDAIIGYSQHRDSSSLSDLATRLREVLVGRTWWRSVAEGSWLDPRAEAEVEWHRLTEMLAQAAGAFEHQWLEPPTMLAQLAETYSASRSVRLFSWQQELGQAVDLLIEPRLSHDFLEEEFRTELLAHWLETAEFSDDEREVAERMLEGLRAGGSKKAHRTLRFRRSS